MSFLWHGLTEQGAQVPVQVDALGRVIAVDGTPGVSNWERTGTTLSPAVPGDSVDIGSGNISLNADGSAEYAGYLQTKEWLVLNARGATGSATGEILWLRTDSQGGTSSRASINTEATALGTYSQYSTDLNFIQRDVETSGGTDHVSMKLDGQGNLKIGGTLPAAPNIILNADGSASFAGNITAPNVTFRSADPQFYVKKSKNKDAQPEYVGPELDLLAEIARLEALVRHLYETLRLAPPAGWPVWDGNDDVLRQLRK